MTSAEQQEKVAEYQSRVDVLKALLAEAETRLTFFRNVTPEYRRPPRQYPPAPFQTAAQPQDACTVQEVLADTRTSEELKLDHRSGSGENSAKCREEFVKWLGDHGLPGDWQKTAKMCGDLSAWHRFSKHVVDEVLEQLILDGVVEVEWRNASAWPTSIRLKQPAMSAVY